eukprot:g20026.t1
MLKRVRQQSLEMAVASCLYFCLPALLLLAQVCCLFALARPVCGVELYLNVGLGVKQTSGLHCCFWLKSAVCLLSPALSVALSDILLV